MSARAPEDERFRFPAPTLLAVAALHLARATRASNFVLAHFFFFAFFSADL